LKQLGKKRLHAGKDVEEILNSREEAGRKEVFFPSKKPHKKTIGETNGEGALTRTGHVVPGDDSN